METTEKKTESVWDTLKTIFWALLIAAAFRSFLYQPFSIPSGSMKPTLLVGDYLFVTKFSYGYSNFSFPFAPGLFDGRIWSTEPERGDVVVFKHPQFDACSEDPFTAMVNFLASFVRPAAASSDCVDYVKRVVGLPGDQVQVKEGILHINGTALETEQIADFAEVKALRGSPPRPPQCANGSVRLGEICLKQQFVETLPDGRQHLVLNISGVVGGTGSAGPRNADNTAVFEVPEGHFFFMG
ncbi:MAG: signal peptidase I, partial [Pseudomonadota bacterium]